MPSPDTTEALVSPSRRTLLTADEVAATLRVTPRTVRRWTRDGLLDPVRLGGRLIRYTPESLDELLRPTKSEDLATNEASAKPAMEPPTRGPAD